MRAQVEGVSFVPLLRDPGRSWKQGAFSWWNNPGATIVTADYTYTAWPTGQRMMFHLSSDPDENVNLADAPAHRPARERLERMLHAGWPAAAPRR
jgi:hypothetical protein